VQPDGPNALPSHLREAIPVVYSCDGQEESPPLPRSMVPERTESLDDHDAPGGTYIHWVVCNIPSETREIPAGITTGGQLPGGGVQGTGSNGRSGYTAFCSFPPGSMHRYIFTLFALDSPLYLTGPVDAEELLNGMEGHILGTGQLAAMYRRA
jgi:Raf kinase inhibitor-like YbhB/YbcL family protein